MGEFPNKATQFKPGQSGNPNGKPPGKTLTRLLEKLADERFDGDRTRAEAFVASQWEKAIEGDPQAARNIWERLEGKVTDKTELSGPNGGNPFVFEVVDNRKRESDEGESPS